MRAVIDNKEVLIKTHAVKRARQRNIFPSMVYATLNGGEIKRFGKNLLKISKRYKKGKVICIGEDIGSYIIIKTIEWGN